MGTTSPITVLFGKSPFRPMQRRFVLEFLLPPAAKVLAVRRERAAEGTHPVDQGIYREQIEHQLELYFRVAEILHNAEFKVLVRNDFEANPRVFPDPAPERSPHLPQPRRRRPELLSLQFPPQIPHPPLQNPQLRQGGTM